MLKRRRTIRICQSLNIIIRVVVSNVALFREMKTLGASQRITAADFGA
jgi:hypothetical protein